jgi:lipid-A-disaccharide synthase
MWRERPSLRFVLPAAPGLRAQIEPLLERSGVHAPIELLDGQAHAALAACDLTLIASGTATLEAALFKRPMVIAYAMHWLSWHWMKRQKMLPWVGLPNILLRDAAVPELLQGAATPARVAEAGLAWLADEAAGARLAGRFLQLHLELRRDMAQAATDAIATILAR